METLYPQLALRSDGPLEPAALFGPLRPARIELEIGFGKGEHLIAQATAAPQADFIGCEPFLNGMAACLGRIEDEGMTNIRLWHGDARDVLDRLPDASLDRVYLLHPDPWPKARHAKRRFVNPEPLAALARVLKSGALLRIATDHPIYMAWTLEVMRHQPLFSWCARTPDDWRLRPGDWPATRYGTWASGEGRPIWYLAYRRA